MSKVLGCYIRIWDPTPANILIFLPTTAHAALTVCAPEL